MSQPALPPPPLRPRSIENTQTAAWLKPFGICIAIGVIILMFLYAISPGRHHHTNGRGVVRTGNLRGGTRHTDNDAETGFTTVGTAAQAAAAAGSVDTLPRYTPRGEVDMGPASQVAESEHAGIGGERLKPPPYTVDAEGDGRAGIPASPAPVHLPGS